MQKTYTEKKDIIIEAIIYNSDLSAAEKAFMIEGIDHLFCEAGCFSSKVENDLLFGKNVDEAVLTVEEKNTLYQFTKEVFKFLDDLAKKYGVELFTGETDLSVNGVYNISKAIAKEGNEMVKSYINECKEG